MGQPRRGFALSARGFSPALRLGAAARARKPPTRADHLVWLDLIGHFAGRGIPTEVYRRVWYYAQSLSVSSKQSPRLNTPPGTQALCSDDFSRSPDAILAPTVALASFFNGGGGLHDRHLAILAGYVALQSD